MFFFVKYRNMTCFNRFSSSGNVESQRRRRTMSHQDISSLQDGEELYEAVGDDLAYIEVKCVLDHLLFLLRIS